MNKQEYKELLKEDKSRFQGYVGSTVVSWWVTSNYRKGQYYFSNKSNPLFLILYRIHRVYYMFVKLVTGIQLPIEVKSGGGLIFPHYSGIVLAGAVEIGRSCTIHQGCTLGMSHFGKKKGAPTIGDNVIIFPNSNITGNIRIGSNVIIGANSIVTHDIPDNCMVVGAPARIINENTFDVLGEEGRALYWRANDIV